MYRPWHSLSGGGGGGGGQEDTPLSCREVGRRGTLDRLRTDRQTENIISRRTTYAGGNDVTSRLVRIRHDVTFYFAVEGSEWVRVTKELGRNFSCPRTPLKPFVWCVPSVVCFSGGRLLENLRFVCNSISFLLCRLPRVEDYLLKVRRPLITNLLNQKSKVWSEK